jgi:hypothetical protein
LLVGVYAHSPISGERLSEVSPRRSSLNRTIRAYVLAVFNGQRLV